MKRSDLHTSLLAGIIALSLAASLPAADVWLRAAYNAVGQPFYVDFYVDDATDLYGAAFDLVYGADTMSVVDDDGNPANGVHPLMVEGDVLNKGGVDGTTLIGRLENGLAGRAVVGLTRQGQVPGVDVTQARKLVSVVLTRDADALSTLALEAVYLEDSSGAAIPVNLLPPQIARAVGTVVVDVTPDTASWSFVDGGGATHNGTGDDTITSVPAGAIVLTWGALADYVEPSPNPDTQTLTDGGTVTFTGTYTPLSQTGTVVVEVTPDAASWSFTDGVGGTHAGTGDQTVATVPAGQITLTWDPLDGYDEPSPNPDTKTLEAAGSVTFTGVYTPTTPTVRTELFNISTRGWVGSGDNVMIAGVIIEGTTGSQMRVMLTGWGPSLEKYGVPDFLADPTLGVFRAGEIEPFATNDNWRDAQEQEIIDTGQAPPHDLDAAVIVTVEPGAYTAILSGKEGGEGNGLVAAWDVDTGEPLLVNISTRGQVGTGAAVMIAGFIIEGETSKTVGITGWGPSLADFGVPDVLANPTLGVFRAGEIEPFATCDNWQDSEFADAVTSAGLEPANPLEAAIVIVLDPGAYTAILSGVDAGTGNGLAAVWDVE